MGRRMFAWMTLALIMLSGSLRMHGATPGPVKITILGDSIDADEPEARPIQGWGTFLQARLQNAAVSNYASSGRSTKTYMYGELNKDGKHVDPKFWPKAQATPADYWIIKFGGNDSHTLPDQRHTDPDTEFAANLKIYIDTARKLGAKPILVTPFRRPFKKGSLTPELDAYADATRRVAKEENVPLIDMYTHATEWFTSLSPEGLHAYVPAELGGHMNRAGANLLAEWMAEQLVKIVPQLKLATPNGAR